ncbi:MAG: tetratricopeptide repeat protein [Xanthobacteraceae bacterium]
MAALARGRLFGRRRDQTEVLQQQVTALESALSRCAEVAGRWSAGWQVTVAVGIVCLALGFVLGLYREPLLRTGIEIVGLTPVAKTTDDAYAAYLKGNYVAALDEARPLADAGDARAQSLVGLMYYRGRGTAQDHAEATKWFRRAADNGDAAAEFYLGLMFADGQGLPQDYEQAAIWYRRAAERGDAQAQYNLGLAYAKGEGVPVDPVSAHMWFNLAASRFPGNDAPRRTAAAASRDAMAAKLSPEQLAEAQRRAREWALR